MSPARRACDPRYVRERIAQLQPFCKPPDRVTSVCGKQRVILQGCTSSHDCVPRPQEGFVLGDSLVNKTCKSYQTCKRCLPELAKHTPHARADELLVPPGTASRWHQTSTAAEGHTARNRDLASWLQATCEHFGSNGVASDYS